MKPEIQIGIKPVPLDVCLDKDFRREAYALEAKYRAAPQLFELLEWATEKLEEMGNTNDYTLGMVRNISACRDILKKARGEV